MAYESGFTTRKTYSSRPVTTAYSVTRTNKTPIDWEKVPLVPRPSLIADPVTAFGVRRPERTESNRSILDPINRDAIKPSYKILNQSIEQYVPTRDKNRTRILTMVRQYTDTVDAGRNTATMDKVLPYLHRVASKNLPVRRETYRNAKSGAMVTKYAY